MLTLALGAAAAVHVERGPRIKILKRFGEVLD
jgi:hypothetical protein